MNNELENAALTEDKSSGKTQGSNRGSFVAELFDYVEIFSIALIAILLLFTFGLRLCRVDGGSMNQTLLDGEQLITTSIGKPHQGDIIVFHLINDTYKRPLVKRMIADEGQTVRIDLTAKETYVDGVRLTEEYAFIDGDAYNRFGYFNEKYISTSPEGHLIYEVTVPEGKLFAMGDNRNHSSDSRSRSVGFVDKDCVLGKALFRISPFTLFP